MIESRNLPGNYGSAGALGAALGLLSFPVLSKVLANLPLPVSLHYFDQHMSGWLALRLNPLAPELLSSVAERYTDYLSNLPPDIPAQPLLVARLSKPGGMPACRSPIFPSTR